MTSGTGLQPVPLVLTERTCTVLVLKNKKELSVEAFKLASGHEMVRYRNVTYMPCDFETFEYDVVPDPDRTIWMPMDRFRIQRLAAEEFDTLFGTDSELSSFDFMVAQNCNQQDKTVNALLVRTPDGLRELDGAGQLVEVTGDFRPNALSPMLNEDVKAKDFVMTVISNWLDDEAEAHALLHHLATALAPGWSAVKYVLLLGEGRNGKSVLLKMLKQLFGAENVSGVTRQNIADQSAVVTQLNGKLLNIVFDGQQTYLKDSGAEKTLIAGEPYPIRRLYESTPTVVQTNALFLEGLNREPKTGDKTTALQKRLVRFAFPNVYPLDLKFEKRMLREKYLGAFLSLLIDHYVQEDDVAEKLQPSQRAVELQLEQMYVNSLGLQFLKHIEETDELGVDGAIIGHPVSELVQRFHAWRLKENDIGTWGEPDVLALFQPLLNTERKSHRENGTVRKIRVATSLKLEAGAFIQSVKGENADAEILDAVVEE